MSELIERLKPFVGVVKVELKDGETQYYACDGKSVVVSASGTPNVILRSDVYSLGALISKRMQVNDAMVSGRLSLAGDAATIARLKSVLF